MAEAVIADVEEEEFDDFEEDDLDIEDLELKLETDDTIRNLIDDEKEYEKINSQKNFRTRQIMSKYEKARVIGIRAQQIESGSGPLVDIGLERDPIKIAQMELENKVCPNLVKRPIPGRDPHKPDYEICSVNNLV